MKKLLPIGVFLILAFVAFKFTTQEEENNLVVDKASEAKLVKKTKKTPEQRALYAEERARFEYKQLANPATGEIPREETIIEFQNAQKAKIRIDGDDNLRAPVASFVNRGPTNLGGRTRTIVFDKSDGTGNTIIAGGVSGGVFRTTNGGSSWTKVSANDEIHNVSAIAQDPRVGFQNIWYYATGERGLGSSAANGATYYLGQGIWKSIDSGLTWTQMAGTFSTYESFDNLFDQIYTLAVHPTTGELFAAIVGRVVRFNGVSWVAEVTMPSGFNSGNDTDVVITSTGRVYVAMGGTTGAAIEGVWTSATGTGGWTRISDNTVYPTAISNPGGIPLHTKLTGRAVLGLSPSNENKLYVLYVNGVSSDCAGIAAPEADLFMWDQSSTTWTDYSSKLPDEPGCSNGNDPMAVQGGYDLVVSVKPNNENFVVIGGTNAYKMADITAVGSFSRIGGYASAGSYALYSVGGTEHHPDIHSLVFDPTDSPNFNTLFSGTDGGIHKTTDVTAGSVAWTSLNNNYQTQQFYHVAIDPQSASDYVIGGLQDNGTNEGGTGGSLTEQTRIWGGDGVAVGISRDNANVPLFVGSQLGSFYRIFKNVGGWTNIEPAGSTSQFVTYFHLDPDNNKNLYYGGGSILYRTTDATNVTTVVGAGATDWTNMGAPSGLANISRFGTSWGAYNAGTSYLLIGGENGAVHRLDDPQNAASVASSVNITPSGATGIVSGLAIHPTDNKIVMLTYSNYGITSIYITQDVTVASPVWAVAERNLSAHSIRSAAITVNTAGEALYLVGTGRGLYSSTNPLNAGGVDWTREAPNLIGYAVVRSMAYRPADNKLLIGTHGNGMFEATINHVLSLEDNEISESIKVYPNPVSDRLNLSMPNELSDNASFIINNILGQNVMRGTLENSQVDVNSLNTGIYFIQISSNGKNGVKRFIKK
ncbi:T9SS type A sorting domain-containing protein [Flavobacteriaceae bacterium S0825]|uniref:T9SS type A sorting domain-containing protein n=1 Tax=Gaetbulibacter sp. S0825 TaxID=2720084 RepID=UPI001431DC1E|nr:T9SS type A sorting domain-containing protein [Gaetbulibacter sp. S0825]MCK0108570.1 T9SS type A sorting domain-containing protein [Flavobacteriaceae bacterium S0825]NIX64206.1 T9SS type A sorting domain-containing protein [Gaetbulibacter sp. S0825]